jgi:hypothetical protein
MDDRLQLATTLDREADRDFRAASWFMDLATERCREKREQARRLREHVAQEAEIRELQREADAELMRRSGRKNGRRGRRDEGRVAEETGSY